MSNKARTILIGATAAAVLALPAGAQAAVPGDLCTIDPAKAPAYVYIFGGGQYQLGGHATFRVVNYDGPNHYAGHGYNLPDGSMARTYVLQSSCYQ